jgi:hypothetical protein
MLYLQRRKRLSTVRGEFRFSKAVNLSRTYRIMSLSPLETGLGDFGMFHPALQHHTFIASFGLPLQQYEAEEENSWKVPARRATMKRNRSIAQRFYETWSS